MTSRADGAQTGATLRHALQLTGWTLDELWIAATGIGGALSRGDVKAIAAGHRAASRSEHDVLAAALNDWFVDHQQDHPVAAWSERGVAEGQTAGGR